MPNSEKISIIIVNYRSGQYLEKCVASIFKHLDQEKPEIIIVNNDEKESLLGLEKSLPAVKVINAGKNIGFGRAANAGAKIAQGNCLFFLNPDTELLGNYTEALRRLLGDEEVGIVGPGLVKENGKLQEWIAGVEISPLELAKNNLGIGRSRKIWQSKAKKEVAWVSGAALAIKKDLFEQLGGFDENMFMYFEDMDLCRRAREKGKKVIYFPEEKIRHFGGKSVEDKAIQKKHYYASQDYYFKKHYGGKCATLVRFLRKIFVRKNA